MSKKKDEQRRAILEARRKEGICPICGDDCQDRESLQRHLGWAHKDIVKTKEVGGDKV
jgi:hypothetical protein